MAAIPESTRSSVALRLLDHAEQHWPQLHRVQVTSRAGFAYVTGSGQDGQRFELRMPDSQATLSTAEAALILGCSERSVVRAIGAGRLTGTRAGARTWPSAPSGSPPTRPGQLPGLRVFGAADPG